MIDFDFQQQMNRLTSTFGKQHFSDERMALIWRTVKDLDRYQFERIADHFLGNFRSAPLPADFVKAYWEERRAAQTHKTTYQGPEQAEEKPLDCLECFETGFLFVKEETIRGPLLMRCSCQMGANAVAEHIPQWTREATQLFPKLPFPADGFKPKLRRGDSEDKLNEKLWEIVARWQARIQFSEDFWKHLKAQHKNQQEGA